MSTSAPVAGAELTKRSIIIDEMIARKRDQRRVRINWMGHLPCRWHLSADESAGYITTPDTCLRQVQSHGEAPHCSRESG